MSTELKFKLGEEVFYGDIRQINKGPVSGLVQVKTSEGINVFYRMIDPVSGRMSDYPENTVFKTEQEIKDYTCDFVEETKKKVQEMTAVEMPNLKPAKEVPAKK